MLLDSRLADAFTMSRATGKDAAEVHELVAADVTAVLGFCPVTEEDIRACLEPPAEARSISLLVRDRPGGSLAQWWDGCQDPGGSQFYIGVRTDPRVPDSVGDELTQDAWKTLRDWICREADPDQGGIKVFWGSTSGDARAARRIGDAGFTHERTFWEMRGPVLGSAEPPPVNGLTLTATDDAATVYAVLDKGFAGHWGFESIPFEGWLALEKSMPGYDAGLWVLAEVDATPAASMILSRRSADEDSLYVQELATLAPYRKRGIASALLRHAFDVARAEGYSQVTLHVDSDKADSAPSLYRTAGLDVRSAFDVHTITLPNVRRGGGKAHGRRRPT